MNKHTVHSMMAACLLYGFLAGTALGADYSGWSWRMPISFPGYTPGETLTNFPVLVVFSNNIQNSGFSYGQFASTNGLDLRFSDASGTNELCYEIEKWATNGPSYIWVRIPELNAGQSVLAYWGNTGATGQQAYCTNGAVWTNGYAGVWHMAQTSGTNALDSTSRRISGVLQNMDPGTDWVAACIDGGVDVDGTNDLINVGDGKLGISGGAPRTLSGWVKSRVTTYAPWTGVFGIQGTVEQANHYFDVEVDDGNNYMLHVWGTDYHFRQVDTNWHFMAATYTGGTIRIYLDGALAGGPFSQTLSTDDRFVMGGRQATSTRFNGLLDEIRIANVVHSPNWIWACWMNGASNTAFNSYGTVGSNNLPWINNSMGATGVTGSSATLNGMLISTGSAPADVTVCWGTNDAGTNMLAWQESRSFGVNTSTVPVSYSTNIAGLLSETTYYYRFFATNSYGGGAGPVSSFTTGIDKSQYAWRAKVTFSGYTRTETLTNFPALVVLSENLPGFAYGQFASTNGYDLRVFDEDLDQLLNYEIEKWDTTSNSYIWVQVPALTNGSSVWMYWGGSPLVPPLPCLTDGSVWSDGFDVVMHFGASVSGTNVSDSTAASRSGNVVGTSAIVGAGRASSALRLYGSAADYIDLGSKKVDIGSTWSVSTWFQNLQPSSQWRSIAKAEGPQEFPALVEQGSYRLGTYNGPFWYSGYDLNPTSNVWHHLVAVGSSTTTLMYVDGRYVGASGWKSTSDIRYLGNYGAGNSQKFAEYLDEFRIESAARSSNWVWACYMTAASNSVFTSYSATEAGERPYAACLSATGTTFSSGSLNGYLSSTGQAPTTIYLYYGQSNGGTNPGAWTAGTNLGERSIGSLSCVVPVESNTVYYYRFCASNSFGVTWAWTVETLYPGTISLSMTNILLREDTGEAGQLTFSRSSSGTNGPLTIGYRLGGTASNGTDYQALSGSVTIPAGATSAQVPITAIADAVSEGYEAGQVSLLAGGNYVADPAGVATFVIVDSDSGGRYLYVDAVNGNDANSGTNWAGAKATIQAGIDAAVSGNTVLVAPGTYKGTGNRNIEFKGKNIILKSSGGASATIVDCEQASKGFYIHASETTNAILDGFTVINGYVSGGSTAPGILVNGASPTIQNCIIMSNSCANADIVGAGIGVWNGNSRIINCLIVGNTSGGGTRNGAVCFVYGLNDVINCTFSGNTLSGNDSACIQHEGNNGSLRIINTIMWGNTKPYDIRTAYKTPSMSYSCVQDGSYRTNGTGNITNNPLFVAAGDCHLQSNSPCINKGTTVGALTTDLSGSSRTLMPDMGVYEYGANNASLISGYTFTSSLPQITVISVTNRYRSNLVDIYYTVTDSDSPQVEVRGFAMAQGAEPLFVNTFYPISTVVEGTGAYYGTNVLTGPATNHIAWDFGTDVGHSVLGLKLHLIACDTNTLPVSQHFVTVPASGALPGFRISRYAGAGQNAALQRVWMWAILKGLANKSGDSLIAVGGAYNGQTIVEKSSVVTAAGKLWLCEQIGGVRPATEEEVVRTLIATTPGRVTRWPSQDPLVSAANEYGIETGLNEDFYFVKE